MKLTGVYLADNLSYGDRLLKGDIMRLPSPQTNKADFYMSVKPSPKRQRNAFWRNLFTAMTFGLTGLYIAHRNNLFNPIRREAKRIIKSDDFISKIKAFVDSSLGADTYKRAAKKSLEILSENKSRGEEFMTEAKRILNDNNSFTDIFKTVSTRLVDDSNPQRLKDGYSVDMLDKLTGSIERMLRNFKEAGQNYKNRDAEIVSALFAPIEGKANMVTNVLDEIVQNRAFLTVENFVKDFIIKSKFSA